MPRGAGLGDAVVGVVLQRTARALPAAADGAPGDGAADGGGRDSRPARGIQKRSRARKRGRRGRRREEVRPTAGGAAFRAAARRAARQSRRGRAERGVSQSPRLSQLFAMPSLRRRDLVRQLQRQHDVPHARPFAAMPLVRRAHVRSGSLSRVQRLRTGGAGLRHRAADRGAGRDAAAGAYRTDGQRHQRAARGAPGAGRATCAAARST